jgi:hypothetical protein
MFHSNFRAAVLLNAVAMVDLAMSCSSSKVGTPLNAFLEKTNGFRTRVLALGCYLSALPASKFVFGPIVLASSFNTVHSQSTLHGKDLVAPAFEMQRTLATCLS